MADINRKRRYIPQGLRYTLARSRFGGRLMTGAHERRCHRRGPAGLCSTSLMTGTRCMSQGVRSTLR
jgi:hypothetical protein